MPLLSGGTRAQEKAHLQFFSLCNELLVTPTEEQNLSHDFTFPVLKDCFESILLRKTGTLNSFRVKAVFTLWNMKGNSHLLGWERETFFLVKLQVSKEKRGFLESALENGRRYHPISFSYDVTSDINFGIFI